MFYNNVKINKLDIEKKYTTLNSHDQFLDELSSDMLFVKISKSK